jgi:hypothetical protein
VISDQGVDVALILFAQPPDATRFEVASIKRNNAIGGRGARYLPPDERHTDDDRSRSVS